MTNVISFNELELDAVTELANIGVSRAASSLRKMINKQVLLTVPSVDIISKRAAASLIGEREGDRLTAVQQDFEGTISGRGLLIFPESHGLHLAHALLGDRLPPQRLPIWNLKRLRKQGISF